MNKLILKCQLGGTYYTVLKGDSLWRISNLFNLSIDNIVKANPSSELVIHPGQKLIIPNRNTKLLTKEQIPTKNDVKVIDNFSKVWDYIVEDDKIYKSSKGKNLYVDISTDTGARKHLLNFLNNKYNLRGYNDREKEIYRLLQAGTFDYSNYANAKKAKVESSPRKPLAKPYKPNLNLVAPIKLPFTDKVSKVLPKRTLIDKAENLVNNLKESHTSKTKQLISKAKDVYDYYFGIDAPEVLDYLSRGINKYVNKGENEAISKIEIPSMLEFEDYSIIPGTYTGDTIIDKASNFRLGTKDRIYYLPEAINLNDVRLGARNRGLYSPIKTEGLIITTQNPIRNYDDYFGNKPTATAGGPNWEYLILDPKGRISYAKDLNTLKAKGLFAPGYKAVRVRSNPFYDFARDNNGNILTAPAGRGNYGYMSPQIISEKGGKPYNLNFLLNGKNSLNQYGRILGGRVLAVANNEMWLLSGSVNDIDKLLKSLKQRQGDNIRLIIMDNGSYNTGLRTKDKLLTKNDLLLHDRRNHTGGSGLYLIPNTLYKLSYMDSPNIRTKDSDSYKNGHPLNNEVKGVVFHHTAFEEPNLNRVITGFMDPKTERSSHLAINYNGDRIQFAHPKYVTFHAGKSRFNGRDNVNDFMLGIEFLGNTGKKPLTDDLIQSAVEWLKPIVREYNIPLTQFTTHKRIRDEYNNWMIENNLKPTWGKDTDIVEPEFEKIILELKRLLYYPTRHKQGGLIPKYQSPFDKVIRSSKKLVKKNLQTLKREINSVPNKVEKYYLKNTTLTPVGDVHLGSPTVTTLFDLSEHPEATEETVGLGRKEFDRTGDKINYDKDGSIHSKSIVRGLAAIDANRSKLKRMYNLSDDLFDYYRSWIPAIFKTETHAGDNDPKHMNWYNVESGRSNFPAFRISDSKYVGPGEKQLKLLSTWLSTTEFGLKLRDYGVPGLNGESIGLGNTKVGLFFTPKELLDRGYDTLALDSTFKESPEFSGLLTMEALIRNGNQFFNFPNIDKLSLLEKDAMFITGYNQGYKNIAKNLKNYDGTPESWSVNIKPYSGMPYDPNVNRTKDRSVRGTNYYENLSYLRTLTDWKPSQIQDSDTWGRVLPEYTITNKLK